MAMSNAERQRKYRQNRDCDPARRQAYLEKERKKHKADKALGKKKLVANMTEREKRSTRRRWRKQKRTIRARQKQLKDLHTPPNSPDLRNEMQERPGPSRQMRQSRSRQSREHAKCYRDNKLLTKQLIFLKKKNVMFKKQLYREKQKQRTSTINDTPRTKTRKLLRQLPRKEINRMLIFQNVLIEQLREAYKGQLKKLEKSRLSKLLSGSILRKYRMKCVAFKRLGIKTKNVSNEKNCLSRRLCQSVKDFYLRDDVSRITNGVKNTVTSKKVKKQRRILNDSLKNLHLKFLTESSSKISYTTFCRLRPFWVLFPTESDRNTCMCKTCENTQYIATALKHADIISTDNIDGIVESIVCDIASKDCMYDICKTCKCKMIMTKNNNTQLQIEFYQWKTKKEKRMIGNESKNLVEKEVTFTIKELEKESASDLLSKLQQQILNYKRHLFTMRSQFTYFMEKKKNLQEDECLIHVDFSENYVCKMGSEVQGMHFGASKKQLSLHTGIYFIGSSIKQTFCTVSDNIYHGPGAIWAHLKPILREIRVVSPTVRTIEFFSDGPTSQYRQKTNFFLFSTEIYNLGFERAAWNFFEAGHGKGVPDGVGGAMKRNADRNVKYGHDIVSAKSFIENMNNSETKTKEISIHEIVNAKHKVDKLKLQVVPGTMKIHQVLTYSPGQILYRDISCTCTESNECKGHVLKCRKFTFDSHAESDIDHESAVEHSSITVSDVAVNDGVIVDNVEERDGLPVNNLLTHDRFTSSVISDLNDMTVDNSVDQDRMTVDDNLHHDCVPGINDMVGNHSVNCNNTVQSDVVTINDNNQVLEKSWKNIPKLSKCIGKHVIVKYVYENVQDRLYPGFVEDSDGDDLYVECMHRIGKGSKNRFYWPKKNKDKCWFQRDNVLAIIPPPNRVKGPGSQYEVTHNIWESIINDHDETMINVDHNNMAVIDSVGRGFELHVAVIDTNDSNLAEQMVVNNNDDMDVSSADRMTVYDIDTAGMDVSSADRMAVDDTDGVDVSSADRMTVDDTDGVDVSSADRMTVYDTDTDGVDVSSADRMTVDDTDGVDVSSADRMTVDDTDGVDVSSADRMTADDTDGVDVSSADRMAVDDTDGVDVSSADRMTVDNTDTAGMDVSSADRMAVADSDSLPVHGNNDMAGMNIVDYENVVVNNTIAASVNGTNDNVVNFTAGVYGSSVHRTTVNNNDSLIVSDTDDVTVIDMVAYENVVINENENVVVNATCTENVAVTDTNYVTINGSDEVDVNDTNHVAKISIDNYNGVANTNSVNQDSAIFHDTMEHNGMQCTYIPEQSKCLKKYVIVKYDNMLYPGFVESIDEQELYVECMHRVGRGKKNRFYWPKTHKDKCWYERSHVVAIIPQPKMIDGVDSQFEIDVDIWNSVAK